MCSSCRLKRNIGTLARTGSSRSLSLMCELIHTRDHVEELDTLGYTVSLAASFGLPSDLAENRILPAGFRRDAGELPF